MTPYERREEAEPVVAARVEELRANHMRRIWAEVLEIPDGKLLAWDILSKAGLFRPSYTGNAHTNYLEGERNIALWLWGERVEPGGASSLSEMMAAHQQFMEQLEIEARAAVAAEKENEDDG